VRRRAVEETVSLADPPAIGALPAADARNLSPVRPWKRLCASHPLEIHFQNKLNDARRPKRKYPPAEAKAIGTV